MNVKSILRYTVMLLIALLVLLPVLWMITNSFRTQDEIFKYSVLSWHVFLPTHWTLVNYRAIFHDPNNPFGRDMVNTVFVSGTVTILGLIVNSMAAFAFAKLRFPLKKVLFVFFLASLAIPYEVIMIPQYLLIRDLSWINTMKALIVPQIVWVFGIYLLVQFFSDIPRDIIDAARIDGASWPRIYLLIIMPLAKPALITLGLLTFLNQWDAFLWPLIAINDSTKQMIQVAISAYQSNTGVLWGNILSASTVSSVPILIIFLFLQRYYVKGIAQSGVKG